MKKCKANAIQADLGIFYRYSDILRHRKGYSGIIQAYSGIFRNLCNPGIFRTLVYSEP